MSEDLNLPASLERLEINPERLDCCKTDQNRNIMLNLSSEPECTLQSLSLKAECPKGNCHCNRKREKEATVKRLPFKRPIVRRSKLNPLVLRSPVLRLRETAAHPPREVAATLPNTAIIPNAVLTSASANPLSEDVSSTPSLPLPLSRLSGEDSMSSAPSCPPELPESDSLSNAAVPSSINANTASCALQARSSPDDTTIDELASYFDLFVHIPKKMSFMAEMMYT